MYNLNLRSDYLRLTEALSQFDFSQPTLVTYNQESKCLVYQQVGKSVLLRSTSNHYLHEKFKYGVLFPEDLIDLINKMKSIIESRLDQSSYLVSLEDFKTNIYYKIEFSTGLGPTLAFSVDYISTRNKFLLFILSLRSSYFRKLKKSIHEVPS